MKTYNGVRKYKNRQIIMRIKKSYFQTITDKAPAAFLAAVTGYGIFQLGEDYGAYQTYQRIDPRQTSSMTDLFIQKACPQLSQTELAFGIIKPEENVNVPAFSFVLEKIAEDESIPVLSNDSSNDTLVIFINSPGGSVSQTEDFLKQAKRKSDKIFTIVNGIAASAAFKIAISGSPGSRLMTADSQLMVHEASAVSSDGIAHQQYDLPFISFERWGVKHTNQEIKLTMQDASAFLSEKCLNALLQPKTDTYIPALDALKLGLTDAIVLGSEVTGTMPQGTPAMVRKGDPREFLLESSPKP